MNMEARVEAMGCKDYTQIIIKGKRTKRQRPASPLDLTMASSSSSATQGSNGGGGGVNDNSGGSDCLTASPTNSIEFTKNTEEEDMANCLILLAQGGQTQNPQNLSSPVPAPVAATANKAAGSALSSSNKSRVHECSICGTEFTSGQALGGHMRRHRTMSVATTSPHDQSQEEAKKPRSILSLDLNLPAPEDNHPESKLVPLTSKGQVIVFSSASSLVDCHY
ncbi:hypothetical protein F0562_016904 [Nyssa sinensis]|uniref:C2H2-type domain-containing protein n=1 Tax=Nyssa sinensis TaxID=561372 RepID=A0A5J4ZDN3_9ASTE|nr:hypothetical protein F0562_016904 [Nyssa sinensis]